jgi:hypothetical protein
MNKRSRWMQFIPLIVSLLIAGAAIYAIIQTRVFEQIDFTQLHWGFFLALIAARLIYFVTTGLLLDVYVRANKIQLAFSEWFSIAVVSYLTNAVTPIGGAAAIRAGYLKLKYQFPLAHFSGWLAVNVVINYFVAGLIGANILIFNPQPSAVWTWMFALMIAILLIAVIAILIPLERMPLPGSNKLMLWARSLIGHWGEMRSDKRLLGKLTLIAIVFQLSEALSYTLALGALHQPLAFQNMLFVSVMTNIVRVTPIRDVFGLSELAAGLGTQILQSDSAQGLALGLLVRIATLGIAFILAPICAAYLSRQIGGVSVFGFAKKGEE